MNSFVLSHPLRRTLYSFLKECNKSSLEKIILDCGAGGTVGPLVIFHEYGFKTFGIDISDSAIAANAVITFDIDGIASGTAGKGLVIELEVTTP